MNQEESTKVLFLSSLCLLEWVKPRIVSTLTFAAGLTGQRVEVGGPSLEYRWKPARQCYRVVLSDRNDDQSRRKHFSAGLEQESAGSYICYNIDIGIACPTSPESNASIVYLQERMEQDAAAKPRKTKI